jgi:hypothetical protein
VVAPSLIKFPVRTAATRQWNEPGLVAQYGRAAMCLEAGHMRADRSRVNERNLAAPALASPKSDAVLIGEPSPTPTPLRGRLVRVHLSIDCRDPTGNSAD